MFEEWAPSKVSPKQFLSEQIIHKDSSLSLIPMPHIQRDMNKIRADQCLIYFTNTADREVRGL